MVQSAPILAAPPSYPLSPHEQARLKRRKIISLFGSVCVALSAGSNYAFSSFAPQIQESLHLTSTQINLIGIAGNAGVYLSSPLWGKFIDKRGPKLALIAAAFLTPIGYAGLSASYTGSWSLNSTSVLIFFNLLTGLGNSGGFTAAMNAQAKSWGGSTRGTATALVLSGFGLSAFFYSTLSHYLFAGNIGEYLLLLAFGSMTSMVLGLLFIKIIPPTEHHHHHHHSANDDERDSVARTSYIRKRTSSEVDGRTAVWDQDEIPVTDSSDTEDDDDDHEGCSQQLLNASVAATSSRSTPTYSQPVGDVDGQDPERQGLLVDRTQAAAANLKQLPQAIDISGRKLFKQIDFFLLFFVMTLVSGAGLLLINNVGTITKTLWDYNHRNDTNLLSDAFSLISTASLDDPVNALRVSAKTSVQQLQAHQVSAISLCNASGRIIIGLLSDFLVKRTGTSANRVWLLLVVTSLAFTSQLLASLPNTIETVHQLLSVSILTGLAYGTLFGLCPVLVFEWFGMKHFSQNYGFVSLSPVIAGNVFNLLFGRIYDSHVPKENDVSNTIIGQAQDVIAGILVARRKDDNQVNHRLCMEGEECYRQVFVITTLGCLVAFVLSAILIVRRAHLPTQLASLFRSTRTRS